MMAKGNTREQLIASAQNDIASYLNLKDSSAVQITDVSCGSLVVNFVVTGKATTTDGAPLTADSAIAAINTMPASSWLNEVRTVYAREAPGEALPTVSSASASAVVVAKNEISAGGAQVSAGGPSVGAADTPNGQEPNAPTVAGKQKLQGLSLTGNSNGLSVFVAAAAVLATLLF